MSSAKPGAEESDVTVKTDRRNKPEQQTRRTRGVPVNDGGFVLHQR